MSTGLDHSTIRELLRIDGFSKDKFNPKDLIEKLSFELLSKSKDSKGTLLKRDDFDHLFFKIQFWILRHLFELLNLLKKN